MTSPKEKLLKRIEVAQQNWEYKLEEAIEHQNYEQVAKLAIQIDTIPWVRGWVEEAFEEDCQHPVRIRPCADCLRKQFEEDG